MGKGRRFKAIESVERAAEGRLEEKTTERPCRVRNRINSRLRGTGGSGCSSVCPSGDAARRRQATESSEGGVGANGGNLAE